MIIVTWKNEDESKTKTEDPPVLSEDPMVRRHAVKRQGAIETPAITGKRKLLG